MNRFSRQKINKATEILNDTIEQLDSIDIFRTLHYQKAECTFFSSVHGIFSMIYHILDHRTNLNKYKHGGAIASIFSHNSGMKLEHDHRKISKKKTITWRLNNMLQENQWVNDENEEEILKYLEVNDTTIQKPWDATKAVLRGKFIVI